MLASAEEITELKKARRGLERRMEKIEKSQRPTVVMLSGQLGEIIEGIESAQEKERTMWNPAVSTRIRLAKKGMLLAKELARFEMWVAGESKKGNISEDAGKRFMSIIKLIRTNKMQAAKKELGYFEEIEALAREYERTEEEMEKKDQVLRREQLRIEKVVEEMAGLERETIDLEKVRRHEELLKNLEKLKGLRAVYIRSLLSKPVVEMLAEAEGHSLKEYWGGFPEKDEMAQLRQFFLDYPVLGKCSAGQICEFFECSEKKLSHFCPETSRFKKIVLRNRNLFETAGSLEQTAFLAVDGGEEKALDFYARNIEGAQEAVGRIRQLKKENNSDREEYEKSRRMEKRREELAKYSKNALEEELKAIRGLLELLHSEAREGPAQKEAVEERPKDAGGPLSGIGLLIKKLSGKP